MCFLADSATVVGFYPLFPELRTTAESFSDTQYQAILAYFYP